MFIYDVNSEAKIIEIETFGFPNNYPTDRKQNERYYVT